MKQHMQKNKGVVQASPSMNKGSKLEMSVGKNSVVDSDVDGLINWAKDLPDDISVSAGQSFYKNIVGLNQNQHPSLE